MMKALTRLGLRFQVRAKDNAAFTSWRGHPCLLCDLIKPGEQVTARGRLFHASKGIQVTVHLIWEAGHPQPWCLVTNDCPVLGLFFAPQYKL